MRTKMIVLYLIAFLAGIASREIHAFGFTEVAKLNGTISNANFGLGVALSQDGKVAMVGGPYEASNTGAVVAFERLDNGTWVQQGDRITVTNTLGFFGFTLALNYDGSTAMVSAVSSGNNIGTAIFFGRLPNKTWVQQGAIFQGSDSQGTAGPVVLLKGMPVAMDRNATRAFLGNNLDNGSKGAVWVVVNDGHGNWTQAGFKLTPNDAVGSSGFGGSLAISGDARILLVGGATDNSNKGAAWAFARLNNGTYVQLQPKLVPDDATVTAQFGMSVALSADGNTAMVGAPIDSSTLGALWVFVMSETGTFIQQTKKIVPSNVLGATGVYVGWSVSLSSDGYTALVGGFGDSSDVGAAWVYCRYDNGSWIQSNVKITVADYITPPEIGMSLAYSSDAARVVIGGPDENHNVGAAWVFDESTGTCPGAPAASQATPVPTPRSNSSSVVAKGHPLLLITAVLIIVMETIVSV